MHDTNEDLERLGESRDFADNADDEVDNDLGESLWADVQEDDDAPLDAPPASAAANPSPMGVNLDDTRRWIAALAGDPDAPMTWQIFVDAKSAPAALGRTDHGTLVRWQGELVELNRLGHGIFCVVNRTDPTATAPIARTMRRVVEPRSWFVDCDFGDLTQPYHRQPTIVVRSKSGPHSYWRCAPGTTWAQWQDGQRALAVHYRTDPAMVNVDRVLRAPGFLHMKNPANPYLVNVVQDAPDAVYDFADVLPRAVVSNEEWASYRDWHAVTKAASAHGGAEHVPEFEGAEWPPLRERAVAWHRAIVAASAHVLRAAAHLPAVLGFDPVRTVDEWFSYRVWWQTLVGVIQHGKVDGAKLARFESPSWQSQLREAEAWLARCRRHKAAASRARQAGVDEPVVDLRFGAPPPAGEPAAAQWTTATSGPKPVAPAGADGTYDPHELVVTTYPDRRDCTVADVVAHLAVGGTARIFCPYHPNTRTPAAFLRRTAKGSYVRCDSCGAKYVQERLAQPPVPQESATAPLSGSATATQPESAATKAPSGYAMTDLGNAERLVAQHGMDLRWSPALGWLVWNGGRWCRDESETMAFARAFETVRHIVSEANALEFGSPERMAIFRWAHASESSGKLGAMVRLARYLKGVCAPATAFDDDPWILNCPNGIIDLRTGTLHPHDRTKLCSKVTGTVFEPDAQAPRWQQFLAEVLPDPDVRGWVQRFLGYCLTGVVREHLFPVWWGTGRNGKGTLIETVAFVVADYATAVDPSLLLERHSDAHATERMPLLGARLVFSSEPDRKRGLAIATMKRLTGGDTMSARLIAKDTVTWKPTHKLVLLANHKPAVSAHDTDTATWERIRLVPFVQEFTGAKQDGKLPEKLRAEAPGILAWLVRGCLDWQRDGLACPPAIKVATDAYRDQTDVVARWVDECCVIHDRAKGEKPEQFRVEASMLRRNFEGWVSQEGLQHALGPNPWGDRLKQLGAVHPMDPAVPGGRSGGRKYWRGIRLRMADEDEVSVAELVDGEGESTLPRGVRAIAGGDADAVGKDGSGRSRAP